MRINIYAEELTNEVEMVKKVTEGKTFYGLRLFLESSQLLHQTATDDDRSAITFWGPYHAPTEKSVSLSSMIRSLQNALVQLEDYRRSHPHK